jgi:DNA invertase Pin-like site-specific DNA recombinase
MFKSAIIYNRVSSIKQNDGSSLNIQEKSCKDFAETNSLNVKASHKDVCSAFQKTSKILTNIINNKKTVIIISNIDRFSRNTVNGLLLADIAIRNKNKLVFIQENLVISNSDDIKLIKPYLEIAENESKSISNRIKRSRLFLINTGKYPGGFIPYGYKVINKQLLDESYEQNVISFIKLCKNNVVKSIELNNAMQKISNCNTPINCYDEKDNIVLEINNPLTHSEIVNLLNDYDVLKRGLKWNNIMIKSIIKNKIEVVEEKFNNLDDMKQELLQLDNDEQPGSDTYNFGISNDLMIQNRVDNNKSHFIDLFKIFNK